MLLDFAGADRAIADPWYTGNFDITYEQIINVHPFGNEACVVETTGQDILDALEMGARVTPEENGGFLQVSGLTYTIDTSIPSSVVLNDEKEFVKVEAPGKGCAGKRRAH